MWAKLVRQYQNVTLVLSGHEVRGAGQDAAGHRLDLGVNGNLVNQILSNYQNMTNGGNGYLRIMKFHPLTDTIDVSTYSPYLNSSLTDSTNQFTVPWHKWTGAGNGSIAGVVKDISSCSALAGAIISSSGGSAVAGSSGTFTIGSLAPSTYTISANYSGYTPVGKSIQVGPALTASGKVFLGTGSGQIKGTITSSSGTPLSGATVHLTGSASASGCDQTITTDPSGKYSPGSAPGGTYQITASAAVYSSSTATSSLGTGATLTQNFVLTSTGPIPKTGGGTGTITGQVGKDDTAVVLAGAIVKYSGGSTTTNSNGFYTLSNVPAGSSISVTASAGGYQSMSKTVSVTGGATSTLSFALLPNCTINTIDPSVTICLPTANSTVLNPIHIIATATDTHTVNYTQVWVDGTKAYQVPGSSLNANVSMSTGVTHRLTVQAIDSINQIFKTTIYVTAR